MALHLRKLLAAAIALTSLLAFSAPSLGHQSSGTSHAAHRHQAPKRHHHSHHRGIPQHNGGDHDADNNGGPSDGDGNI